MRKRTFIFFAISLFFSTIQFARANAVEIYLYYDNKNDVLAFDKYVSPPVSLDKEKTVYIPDFDAM